MMDNSPGGARTLSASSGGYILANNNISTNTLQVFGANSSRTRVTFCNPGVNTIYVAPMIIQNNGTDAALTPNLAALGGCILIPAGDTLVVTEGAGRAWQAFASTGSSNPLTIILGAVQ